MEESDELISKILADVKRANSKKRHHQRYEPQVTPEDVPGEVSVRKMGMGRRKGKKDIPLHVCQKIALEEGTNKEVAMKYGVSLSGVSRIRTGHVGLSRPFVEHLEEKVQSAKLQAAEKLLAALSKIDFSDVSKMKATSLRDISTIALNMARIVETGAEKESEGDRARVIVYAPEVKQVNNYATVTVEE